jgi:hypothetical protein
MKLLEAILLIHILQFVLQLQKLIILYNEVENETMMGNLMEDLFRSWASDSQLLFVTLKNVVVLHQFQLSCNFELLMTKDVVDWVKARSNTWYSYFFMM